MPPSKVTLAKIHIAKKELGLTDEAYRDILRRIAGKDSAAGISEAQAEKVLRHFVRLGWRPKYQQELPGITIPKDLQSQKVRALWITLRKAGVVRNGSDLALLHFVKRVTGRHRLEWCSADDKNKVIEALKDWARREKVELE